MRAEQLPGIRAKPSRGFPAFFSPKRFLLNVFVRTARQLQLQTISISKYIDILKYVDVLYKKKNAGVLLRTVFRRTISVQNRALLSECRVFSQEKMCVRGFFYNNIFRAIFIPLHFTKNVLQNSNSNESNCSILCARPWLATEFRFAKLWLLCLKVNWQRQSAAISSM